MKITKQGFTLIEQLVVVAFISILATAAFISLQAVNKNALNTSVLSDVRQLQVQANLYFQSKTGFGPAGDYPACNSGVFADAEFTRIKNIIINKYNSSVSCAIGLQGSTFAVTFTSVENGIICIDQSRIKEGVSHIFVNANTPVECP